MLGFTWDQRDMLCADGEWVGRGTVLKYNEAKPASRSGRKVRRTALPSQYARTFGPYSLIGVGLLWEMDWRSTWQALLKAYELSEQSRAEGDGDRILLSGRLRPEAALELLSTRAAMHLARRAEALSGRSSLEPEARWLPRMLKNARHLRLSVSRTDMLPRGWAIGPEVDQWCVETDVRQLVAEAAEEDVGCPRWLLDTATEEAAATLAPPDAPTLTHAQMVQKAQKVLLHLLRAPDDQAAADD